MSQKLALNPKEHKIVRVSKGANLYQLCLFKLGNDKPEQIEELSSLLKTSQANLRGLQLAKQLKIPFVKKLKAVWNKEDLQQKAKIKRQAKKAKRQQWVETQKERWQQWQSHYPSEKLALANGVQIMNRWVKNLGRIEISYDLDWKTGDTQKYKVYERGMERVWVQAAYQLKDIWLEQNQQDLTLGQKVRCEVSWNERGKTSQRWLYYHEFLIEGEKFDFHSYTEPIKLEEGLAPDFPPMMSRKRLSPKEISEVERKCGVNSPDLLIEMMSWKLIAKKPW